MKAPAWTLGDVVRKLRQAKDWTQQKLASEAEVNPISVVRLERDSERADRRTIERVARALGESVADLYAITEEAKLLAELSSAEHRHVLDYVRRLREKRRASSPAPVASPPLDRPAQDRESREPIQKRQRQR